jgi:uncharacterized phage protein (TIGR01671 family)
MREIKFRGKRKDGKGWSYGFVYEMFSKEEDRVIIDECRHFDSDGVSMDAHEVDLNTVGQFIGLRDKTNKEIYEGDIVERTVDMRNYCDADGTSEEIYAVEYIGIRIMPFSEISESMDEYEIIGNVFENPELLK